MRNLHFAPKFENIYFYTTENFGVKKIKILIFVNDRKTRIQTVYLVKYFGICILWHHEIRIVWFILHETLSQKLNSTKSMTRLFKAKSLLVMANEIRIETIPTLYTWSAKGIMSLPDLLAWRDQMDKHNVKSTKRKSVTFLIFFFKTKQNKATTTTTKKKKKCINYFCTEYIADMHCLRTNHNQQP